jgi:large subunit ribosomal protein L24
MNKLKAKDTVQVTKGKDRGKTGSVLQVFPTRKRASVDGINITIKNIPSQKEGEKGQRLKYPAPVPLSNLTVVCPKCGKTARMGIKILESKKRARVCKKCREVIDS